ncbi:MAG: response regulator [Gammaproteobacteria bacterium]|nr:MAG: response regulator [Gammaproteobacteria bacterium]
MQENIDVDHLLLKGIESIEKHAVFALNTNGKVIRWNAGAERLTGYADGDMEEKSIAHFYEEEKIKSGYMEQLLEEAKTRGRARRETWWIRKDGRHFWASVEITAIYNEGEKLLGYCVISEDLSERKKLEEERLTAEEDHRKYLANLVDTMCHEIRNNLTGILSIVELKDLYFTMIDTLTVPLDPAQKDTFEKNNHEVKNLIEIILLSAEQQKKIVDRTLAMSKLKKEEVKLDYLKFNPKNVILYMIKTFTPQLEKKHLILKPSMPPEDFLIELDQARLMEILINLIYNAIKFTEKGEIMLSMAYKPIPDSIDEIELFISVEDTGIGMTEEEQQRLFKDFSQANIEISSQYGGSGLGLAITKKFIELMKGHIEVKSQKHVGTKFSFGIPCKSFLLEAEQEIEMAKRPSPANEVLKRILIVEDNKSSQKILELFLKDQCYQTVNNGLEAIEACTSSAFDAIFMDIMMPVMDGLEATKHIREIEKAKNRYPAFIVGLSAATKDQQQAAMEAGMDAYVTKPFKKQDIMEVLSQHEGFSTLPVCKKPRVEPPPPEFHLSSYEGLRLFQARPASPSHTITHTFEFNDQEAQSVIIAGTFNQWLGERGQVNRISPNNNTANDWQMKKVAMGRWILEKPLPIGHHQYRFVIDNDQWGPLNEVDIGGSPSAELVFSSH